MAGWDWDQFDPFFASRLRALVEEGARTGHHISLTSGRRSVDEQIALRRKNGCPDIWQSPASSCRVPTAIPGSSQHNHGRAADIGGDREWAHANAARFGLHFNVQGEDWHIEAVGDEEAQQNYQYSGEPISFNFDWMEEKKSPEDELADRLFQMQGILTSGSVEASTPDEMVTDPASLNRDTTLMLNDANNLFDSAMPGIEGQGVGQYSGQGIPPPGYVPPGDGVERWRPIAIQALQYAGEDPKWVDLMLRRINQESGGNPNAVNNWDSNAQRGDPTKGLMQNIGSAFSQRAGELAGRGIFDGFANMVAAIRYTKQRYGDLGRGWSRRGGY